MERPSYSHAEVMKTATTLGIVGLVSSLVALALAPLALDPSYSWLEHTTSESGGQGVDGAWVARTGFLFFGLAVVWIALQARDRWGRTATVFHMTFAVCMIAVAAYSLRAWFPDAPFDTTEDALHSVAATVMGFAFALGVTAVAVRIQRSGHHWRILDGVAVLASIGLPIGMGMFGEIDGGLQRLMFLIAYIWYAREAIQADQIPRSTHPTTSRRHQGSNG